MQALFDCLLALYPASSCNDNIGGRDDGGRFLYNRWKFLTRTSAECLRGEGQAEMIDVPARCERTWRDRTRASWRGAPKRKARLPDWGVTRKK